MKTKSEKDSVLDQINPPVVEVTSHKEAYRLTILNSKKSAYASIIFIALPILFLTGVVFKHYLNLELGFLTSVYEWVGSIDKRLGDHSILNWAIRLALLFGPVIAVIINLLGVLHIKYEKQQKEIIIAVKLKWLNWIIIIGCKLVFAVFAIYLVLENL